MAELISSNLFETLLKLGQRVVGLDNFATGHQRNLAAYCISANVQPAYRDFRAGDVRHSQADISKAGRLLGYAPTHRLAEGIAQAMPWYAGSK